MNSEAAFLFDALANVSSSPPFARDLNQRGPIAMLQAPLTLRVLVSRSRWARSPVRLVLRLKVFPEGDPLGTVLLASAPLARGLRTITLFVLRTVGGKSA